MNRYALQELITDSLADASEWARGDGIEFTRDDIENVFNETLDSAFTYPRDVYALWADFGHPEPWEMADSIDASIHSAVLEAIHESDVLLNAINEADLEDVYNA